MTLWQERAETALQSGTLPLRCSWYTLTSLTTNAPPDIPPSPKNAYRSHYTYRGWADGDKQHPLDDPEACEYLSNFEIILRLVDFSPLRPVLAQLLGWTPAQGWKPFDPVSIFLLLGWQITNGWSRAQTLRNLHHPRYADLALLLGFEEQGFPTEGGLRYWLITVGENAISDETIVLGQEADELVEVAIQLLNQLIAQSVWLMVNSGFFSQEAWEETFVCPDGMLHHAASASSCSTVSCLPMPKRRSLPPLS